MVKELMHDPIFLSMRSEPATPEDLQVAEDLLETLTAHKEKCVGMAANMIGVCKRIIVVDNEGTYLTMFNPEIIKKSGLYETLGEDHFQSHIDDALTYAQTILN